MRRIRVTTVKLHHGIGIEFHRNTIEYGGGAGVVRDTFGERDNEHASLRVSSNPRNLRHTEKIEILFTAEGNALGKCIELACIRLGRNRANDHFCDTIHLLNALNKLARTLVVGEIDQFKGTVLGNL